MEIMDHISHRIILRYRASRLIISGELNKLLVNKKRGADKSDTMIILTLTKCSVIGLFFNYLLLYILLLIWVKFISLFFFYFVSFCVLSPVFSCFSFIFFAYGLDRCFCICLSKSETSNKIQTLPDANNWSKQNGRGIEKDISLVVTRSGFVTLTKTLLV